MRYFNNLDDPPPPQIGGLLFKLGQAELTRFFKAARDAGYDIERIDIKKPDGTMVSIIGGKTSEGATTDHFNEMIARIPST